MSPLRFLLVPIVLAVLPLLAHAQSGVIDASCGVVLEEGVARGAGPAYRFTLSRDGFAFTPALGRAADRTHPLAFSLASVQRGAHTLWSDASPAAAPEIDATANRASIRRGADVVERYDARPDGVLLSFAVLRRPEGRGDLVVRGRLATGLALVHEDAAAGLRFRVAGDPGLGGADIGGVTGIDARGRRAAGAIRCDGAFLELVLPDSFVASAAYPLVIDPLVGPVLNVEVGAGLPAALVDVAYEATANQYLVVWDSDFSLNDAEIRGQRVSAANGALVGAQILVSAPGSGANRSPAAASVRSSGRFLVAWTLGVTATEDGIRARAVNASDAGLSAIATIASVATDHEVDVDVGGDSRTGTPNDALVTWRGINGTALSSIRARLVDVPAAANPAAVGATLTLAAGSTLSAFVHQPRVTEHCGTAGRWLVVWRRGTIAGFPTPPASLEGIVVSDAGAFCTAATVLFTPPAPFVSGALHPDCATRDGTDFLIAWEHWPTSSDDPDVRCRTATLVGSCPFATLAPGAIQTIAATPLDDEEPRVDFARDKYLIAWREPVIGPAVFHEVMLMGLNPMTGAPAGAKTPLGAIGPGLSSLDLAAQWSGGASGLDGALVAWSANDDVRARRVEAIGPGGAVVDLGGGCGAGGTAGTSGPAAICNNGFMLTLSGAASPTATLVIGTSLLNLPCGPCVLRPTPDIVLPGLMPPLPLAIPCDPLLLGAVVHLQWLVPSPAGCPIAPPFSFSNGLSFTIAE